MVPVQTAAVHLSLTSCSVKVSQKALFPRKFPAVLKALDWFPNGCLYYISRVNSG